MSYINDNPLPLLVLFAGVAVIAFLSGNPKGRLVALVSVALGVGLYFLEQMLISPQELVEQEISTMLDNFKNRDLGAITSQIKSTSPELVDIAEKGLSMVDLDPEFKIRSADVVLESDDRAVAMVRANGEVTIRAAGGGTHRVPNYWKTVWHKSGDQWQLAEVTRLNPVNGKEMGYFAAN